MIAFDTNILVYAQQKRDQVKKHEKAKALLANAVLQGAIIPLQVLIELGNVCVRKLGLSAEEITSVFSINQTVFDCPPTRFENLVHALHLIAEYKFSYFDAIIVAVAIDAGATILLSEDMHDGLVVDGLRVINPFVAGNDGVLADYFAAFD